DRHFLDVFFEKREQTSQNVVGGMHAISPFRFCLRQDRYTLFFYYILYSIFAHFASPENAGFGVPKKCTKAPFLRAARDIADGSSGECKKDDKKPIEC
ncbi:MAG: hypothetical protein IJ973_00700, partial [Christensenellaceae bacterium]|nr:hypothetical protein [Christensenellaceae bacterium]